LEEAEDALAGALDDGGSGGGILKEFAPLLEGQVGGGEPSRKRASWLLPLGPRLEETRRGVRGITHRVTPKRQAALFATRTGRGFRPKPARHRRAARLPDQRPRNSGDM
jgi:hypothetical protein